MRIDRVVTRVGDKGDTQLIGGDMVSKSSDRVQAYGEVDELNSWIGLAVAFGLDESLQEPLEVIQHRLFTVGADLANPKLEGPRVQEAHVLELEEIMEGLMEDLPPLEEFILPGGGTAGAALHVARTVCRRAERTCVALSRGASVNPQAIVFLNRLSDLLFVMARVANKRAGAPETLAEFRKARRPRP